MSDHILDLLGAYLDGELHGRQLTKVESHLAECETCRAEFKSLQALSGILREVSAADFPSAERFASNVTLRLARRPVKPVQQKVLEIGWWMVPAGLLVAWIFINTATFVGHAVSAANEIGLLDGHAAWLASAAGETDWSARLGQFGLLSGDNLRWAEITESFTRTTIPAVTWRVSIALLYLCWIALWWSRSLHRESGQLPDNGAPPAVK